MNIIIITLQPFPTGLAATNRVYLYAKGLEELGNTVKIYILEPTELAIVNNKKISGVLDNIYFQYTCGTTIISAKSLSNSWILRQLFKIKKVLLFLYGVINLGYILTNNRKYVDIILLYVEDNPIWLLYFKLLSKITNSKLITDKSELPFFLKKRNKLFMNYLKVYMKIIYSLFDGIIVISNSIKHFISPYTKSGSILQVPILVNLSEINIIPNTISEDYIAYCGNLSESKDGVLSLITAFSVAKKKLPKTKLYLIGDTLNRKDKDNVLQLIKQYCLEKDIILTGFVNRSRMLNLIKSAKCLALLKPLNFQSESCFPTKIGEYLATGNPVITTSTGEIPNYLHTNISAYISSPGDITEAAYNIIKVFENATDSAKIGMEGRKICEKHFDYRIHSIRINEFFKAIVND